MARFRGSRMSHRPFQLRVMYSSKRIRSYASCEARDRKAAGFSIMRNRVLVRDHRGKWLDWSEYRKTRGDM